MRFGLNEDLGFSEKDRNENIRRIAHVGFPSFFLGDFAICREWRFILHNGEERTNANEYRSRSYSQIPRPLRSHRSSHLT